MMKKLQDRLKVIFAYGIDWAEYKDKDSKDHDVSTFAGKIKAEHLENLAQSIEKDILELIKEIEDSKTIKFDIAGGDDYKIMGETVVGVDQLIEHKVDGYYNPYQELRLKLKEYFK
jgi:hypothetical protein